MEYGGNNFDVFKLNSLASEEPVTSDNVALAGHIRSTLSNNSEPLRVYRVHLLDRLYALPSRELVEEMIAMDLIDRFAWRKGSRDCDDFAFGLFGALRNIPIDSYGNLGAAIAFGTIFGTLKRSETERHAANIVALDDGRVLCVEPQNDSFMDCGDLFTIIDTLII